MAHHQSDNIEASAQMNSVKVAHSETSQISKASSQAPHTGTSEPDDTLSQPSKRQDLNRTVTTTQTMATDQMHPGLDGDGAPPEDLDLDTAIATIAAISNRLDCLAGRPDNIFR